MDPVVKVTVADYVATVMMDRPPVNAQSDQLRDELIAAFDSFTDRDDVRVAILTGFGRMFSSKADFNALAEQAFRLARDSAIRAEVIAGQQTRRAVFLESRVVRHLESLLSKLVPAVDAPIHAPLRLVTSADTRRIAVVKLDHIGDQLLASPVFNSLHSASPKQASPRLWPRAPPPSCKTIPE